MKIVRFISCRAGRLLALATCCAATTGAHAQTTNWVAYNDHRPSTTPVANGWAITAPWVGGLNMGAPADTTGRLINFRTGDELVATVTFTRTGSPDDFGTRGRPVPTNTPMARLFYGICDLSNDGVIGVRAVPPNTAESFVTMTFGGLNPTKRYVFRGSDTRNGGYGTRWSVATLSADGWTDAHINGNGGPGVLTANNFPTAGLAAGQAAWNSGANPEGAVVGWNDIAPLPDGTFTIVTKQHTGAIPGGIANGPYGYSFGAMMLAEVEIVAPTITANPPASTTVEQNRRFSLSVAATGAPLNYQWYKQGLGEIPGATLATYGVAQAAVSQSGLYYAVVYNALARRTSTVAQVTVFADTVAPTVETIFSYPTVDAGGVATLDQIIIEFSEAVTPASVGSPASYTLSSGGNPASVIVTNDRSVVLVLGAPMAEDTDYSVTLNGATDAVGNVAGSSSASFHSWVSGIGNGMLMESYNVDAAIDVESLLASPNYPNNPFRRDTLRAFDSRLVFPDNTQEGYGSRIRGVFIPPVSGNWSFFFRTRNLGVVNLNPNGMDEAGKREILRQSTENAPFNWDRFSSSLYSLRAGRAYFIEGLYKGGVGEDYIKVAARLAGSGFPTPVDSPNTDVDVNSMAGAAIAFPLAPRNLGGSLTMAQDVPNLSVDENNPATFAVVVNNPSALPLQYQWYRDGAPISGANGPTYTILPTIVADNGATFSVTVAKLGSTITSRTATLAVVPDITGPQPVEVFSTNLTHVVVRYNEIVDLFSGGENFNYTVLELNTAVNAILQPDGKTVIVELAEPLLAGGTYDIRISDVTDIASNPMDPNPEVLTFTAGTDEPRLTVKRSGASVQLSWPVTAAGYILEQTTALQSPFSSTVWTPVGLAPSVVRGKNNVSVSAGSGNKAFRLRR